MSEGKPLSPAARAILAKRGNPYAFVDGQVEEVAASGSVMSEHNRAAYRRSENPHAHDYYATGSHKQVPANTPASETQPVVTKPATCRISKAEFRSRCRDVFLPYIPALEKARLRSHHRAFIERNAAQPAEIRYELVAQLQKYNLSGIPGLTSQFNREHEALTEAKLLELERAVGVRK